MDKELLIINRIYKSLSTFDAQTKCRLIGFVSDKVNREFREAEEKKWKNINMPVATVPLNQGLIPEISVGSPAGHTPPVTKEAVVSVFPA